MDGNFLTGKSEGHIDLPVARHFPNSSEVRSIDVLCTRDAAINGVGQAPVYPVSIVSSVGCVYCLLGNLTKRKSGIEHGS